MEPSSYILAIDQGTSSTKTVIFDQDGRPFARGTELLQTMYLADGFVEQDAEEIYQNVLRSVTKCLADFVAKGGKPEEIVSCGISNQRETFVVWNEKGEALHHAVVWQCKRSLSVCDRLRNEGFDETIKDKTGLLIDPYFSGTKVIWLYENNEKVQAAVDSGKAFFGTVDTWLLYKLTGNYLTDHTNASRTLFFNINTLTWDDQLLKDFGLSGLNLPEIQASSSYFGESNFGDLFPRNIPITAMIGDSHAAAFGEGCFYAGIAKATMGTGSSILMNIGSAPQKSGNGMVTTIGYSTESHVEYALEGVIVTCGATIEWLKKIGVFDDVSQTQQLAESVEDNGGVYLVPAFSGLGAPHWDMKRKASIVGISFDTEKAHVVRAGLESIPYQIRDVISAMETDTGIVLKELMIDGGITSNGFVVQFLANLLEKPVVNLGLAELSALGAAYLSGLKSGLFRDIEHLKELAATRTETHPNAAVTSVAVNYQGWQHAIARGITF
ncbi:carbohydrate kinase [Dyadobacter luteus]|uniref:ATP:glycerol 3-phosphotransferase n=1 Tax=Dyadobacter luteus TaxID=2259619 RepID=A0A3D8Y6I2_9BACT|nr:glycerol kinase GlpK [Dyadobacter luteus]REA57812.1 carbohydrate kinase [Dyadobacter luteus]